MTVIHQRVKQSDFSTWLPKSDTEWRLLKKRRKILVFKSHKSARAHIDKMQAYDRTYLPEGLFEYRITEVK